jgi:hypothetical protein
VVSSLSFAVPREGVWGPPVLPTLVCPVAMQHPDVGRTLANTYQHFAAEYFRFFANRWHSCELPGLFDGLFSLVLGNLMGAAITEGITCRYGGAFPVHPSTFC